MAETSGPFDGVPWSQGQWFDFAQAWAPSGVIGTPASSTTAGELALAVNGLNLTLGTGRAWVRGAGYKNDAGKAFAVTANANASLSRRDRIVLRRDLAAKTVTAIRLTGTPASTPAAPALTQSDAGQWDVPLFSFLVPPNSGTALTGIVDERVWVDPGGTGLPVASVSGFVTGGQTTNASGVYTFNHGLGATPSSVSITLSGNAVQNVAKLVVTAVTSTQVQVAEYNSTTGAVMATNPIDFFWTVYR